MSSSISFGDKVKLRNGSLILLVVDILQGGWLIAAKGNEKYTAEFVVHSDNLILLEKAKV